jgi:hypothetical protein
MVLAEQAAELEGSVDLAVAVLVEQVAAQLEQVEMVAVAVEVDATNHLERGETA